MTTLWKRYLASFAVVLPAALIVACTDTDKVPPKGSTITVAANPATIPLGSGAECNLLSVANCGKADVVATVASELGIPLSDQDVRFSSTAGRLFTGTISNPVDAANIPIRTDDFGNATVSLVTSTTATVTAKSGPASGTLTINTVTGNLSQIVLNVDTTTAGCTDDLPFETCSESICIVAEAQDANGDGIEGVVILFKLQDNVVGGNTFAANFSPSQKTTDVNGQALTKLTPDNTCGTQCSGKTCGANAVATTQGGGFQSSPLAITVDIP